MNLTHLSTRQLFTTYKELEAVLVRLEETGKSNTVAGKRINLQSEEVAIELMKRTKIIVNFQYTDNSYNRSIGRVGKSAGLRQATLAPQYIPLNQSISKRSSKFVAFYDMVRKNWRAWSKQTYGFVRIVGVWDPARQLYTTNPTEIEEAGAVFAKPIPAKEIAAGNEISEQRINRWMQIKKLTDAGKKMKADRQKKIQERQQERLNRRAKLGIE